MGRIVGSRLALEEGEGELHDPEEDEEPGDEGGGRSAEGRQPEKAAAARDGAAPARGGS